MQIKKAEQPAHASAEHIVSQQAHYLTEKYRSIFQGASSNAQQKVYGYPPNLIKSPSELEMQALELNAAKGGHGVPLSSASSPTPYHFDFNSGLSLRH